MKYLFTVLIAGFLATRIAFVVRRRRARQAPAPAPEARLVETVAATGVARTESRAVESALGDVRLIAGREIRERVRGRIFRIGTLFMLLAVSAAIVIPTLHGASQPTRQSVGVVGTLSLESRGLVRAVAKENDDAVKFVPETSLASGERALRSGRLDLLIVDGDRIVLKESASAANSPADPNLVSGAAEYLGVVRAFEAARLTPAQAGEVAAAKAVPVQALVNRSSGAAQTGTIIGLVLLFIMLSQYDTWILIGVMQEKSSRVVEVLLATVRPIQLLGGKVLGIGLVALSQATLIVCCALIVAAAVGSDLLKGSAPLVLWSQLLWLFLGYAFYCWMYAAAGSTAERQDQVQTLALPLSVPILIGYVFAITVASTGHADLLFKVLAYLPPTAPFCMPILVALHLVAWWQFVASVLFSVAGTAAMALFAARVYARAVLRTGARVPLRDLVRVSRARSS